MKIAIFYHLLQVNNWKNILDEQINKLCSSGLYKACDFIHIGKNGNEDLPYKLPKFRIKQNKNYFVESDTLQSLWEFCSANKKYNVLYFFNKGVTHSYDLNRSYTTNSWRLYMEYFAINRWKECNELLTEYDTVGTEFIFESNYWDSKNNWREENNQHYSGNFWWATSEYISRLDPNYIYSDEENNMRNRCEFWIGTNNPKYYNFHNINSECRYGHVYNPLEYMDK